MQVEAIDISPEKTPKNPFEIGLVLAGAVSAGAYTAGVMDYLLEVLDVWYAELKKGTPDIPDHGVRIKVITGASAGGMTAAITVAELCRRASGANTLVDNSSGSLLHKAWVTDVDITRLLETKDLAGNTPIKSLLDATAIDDIANDIIGTQQFPMWKPIPYVDDELKLYLTLSNLRGLPYEFKLRGETGFPYGMTDHSDYQYVNISKDMKAADWIKLRNAAVATGAFPIGLSSRLIKRDTKEYQTRLAHDGRDITGLLQLGTKESEPYHFVAVDGGMLNNEPIELARSVWERIPEQDKASIHSFKDYVKLQTDIRKRATKHDNHALILIDPFPDLPDIGKNPTEEDTALTSIISPIIGALRSQSLFKLEELLRAGDSEDHDRFLISPIRYTETDSKALNAIASGFMGGFGGFLAEEFRDHDYHLGRRNAQRFLSQYFVLSLEDADKKGWKIVPEYIVKPTPEDPSNPDDPTDPANDRANHYYPIIPILKGSAQAATQAGKPWPEYTAGRKKALKAGIDSRVKAILQRTLPFGWISKPWVTALLIFLVGLIVSGEFVKAMQSACACSYLLSGLKNNYLLLFQVILFIPALGIVVLRIGKRSIENKIRKWVLKVFLSQLSSWGIKQKV